LNPLFLHEFSDKNDQQHARFYFKSFNADIKFCVDERLDNPCFDDGKRFGWTLARDAVQPTEEAILRPRGKQDDEPASVPKDASRL
jgi:hypothetical protein